MERLRAPSMHILSSIYTDVSAPYVSIGRGLHDHHIPRGLYTLGVTHVHLFELRLLFRGTLEFDPKERTVRTELGDLGKTIRPVITEFDRKKRTVRTELGDLVLINWIRFTDSAPCCRGRLFGLLSQSSIARSAQCAQNSETSSSLTGYGKTIPPVITEFDRKKRTVRTELGDLGKTIRPVITEFDPKKRTVRTELGDLTKKGIPKSKALRVGSLTGSDWTGDRSARRSIITSRKLSLYRLFLNRLGYVDVGDSADSWCCWLHDAAVRRVKWTAFITSTLPLPYSRYDRKTRLLRPK
ncbi:hypothetical protein J6590_060098 [Homalodisca vitripennis]|nr:hypothetical protein J6590_060098 [Homalodisca vitripennis]